MTFLEMLKKKQRENNTLVCVGLDTDEKKLPICFPKNKNGVPKKISILDFNKAIIDATSDLVCAYKPNSAFYEAAEAYDILKKTVKYAHAKEIPVIDDAKRGDIGNTAEQYAISIFEKLHFDAVTIQAYMGFDSVYPFAKYKDKGVIIVVRSSNPGAKDFQDMIVVSPEDVKNAKDDAELLCLLKNAEPLYKYNLRKVLENNTSGNLLAVAGATYPGELAEMRKIAPEMTFLVPAVGKQGGTIEDVMQVGMNSEGLGMIINFARDIIYASSTTSFAEKAREKCLELRGEINKYRSVHAISHMQIGTV